MTNSFVDGQAPTQDQQRWKPTVEIGRTGFRRFGGYLTEEFDPELRGRRGMARLDEMRRNDPDVGAILWAIEMSILGVDWFAEPGGESAADKEAAEFLETCWNDMSMSPRDLLSDICTMFPFGFHLAEIVYKLRQGEDVTGKLQDGSEVAKSKYDDGRIGWRKIAPRHQETVERWDYDEHGGLRGVWQLLPSGEKIYLPIDKCVLFTTRRERGNPEGYSILRNAWHSYYIKTNIQEIEVISAERDMTGIPYFKLPMGADEDDKDAALEVLEKLKWDDQAGVVLPRLGEGEHQQWEFGTVSSAGSPRINTEEVINRCTVAISRSVLAQFLTLGSQGVGSFALGSDMRELFTLVIKGWLDRIEDTINRFMVERLFKLNTFNGLTAIPKLRHNRVAQRQIDIFTTALEKLASLGMPIMAEDWNFIRGELDMPNLSEETLKEYEQKQEEDDEFASKLRNKQLEPEDTNQPNEKEEQAATENWYSRRY